MRQETFVSVRDRPGMIPLFGVDVGTRPPSRWFYAVFLLA